MENREIPNGWREILAEDFCEKVADGTHNSPKQTNEGKLLITSKNIKNYKLEKESAYYISNEDYKEINKRSKVDKWDVLLSMIGTVGETCIIKEEPDFAIKNVGLFKNKSQYDGLWIHYYFQSHISKQYVISRLSGTTQKYITLGDLRKFPIIIPSSYEEQKAIADVLSSLDEKIELLEEENKTLETLAQTIFTEWFVNFNFPGATGEMEESELGEIPKGWRVGKLGEEAIEIVRGFTTSYVEKSNLINLNQKVNKGNYLDKQHFKYYPENTIVPENKFLKKFDILLNSLGEGTLGRVHLYKEDTNNVIADQHISILRFDNKYNFYVYYKLSSKEGQIALMNEISGSTGMTMLNINIVRNLEFVIPAEDLLEKFAEIVLPLNEKVSYNSIQVETLKSTRDTLLPKLMSGEIRVEGFGG